MADFDAPSFSLGLDFDLSDSDPQIATASEDIKAPSVSNHFSVASTILEDDDFETLTVNDSDSETQGLRPKLKRLRRGSTVEETVSSAPVKTKADFSSMVIDDDDDDIDDFSSQEDHRTDEHLSTHRHSVCNSSKFSLNGHGVLTKQEGKRKQTVLNGPESIITSCNKQPFPKLTVSPLRRFQLLDSDSDFDDPFTSEGATNKTQNKSEPHLNRDPPVFAQHVGLNEQKKLNESVNAATRKDLWEDFQPKKSFQTPAFDEFCEEYFSSKKDKSKSQSNIGRNNENIHVTTSVIDLDDSDTRPPAHQYFFHADPRVQDLVRTRLPYFFPLNAVNTTSEQPSTSNIDYMGQFSHGEKPKQTARSNKAETSSRKSRKQDAPQGFRNPKVAGKRRVQADGRAAGAGASAGADAAGGGGGGGAGHWFTNQDGKRVYVSKNGQELTGRAAYMLYKKERGGGFKSKKAKKGSTKKK